MTTTAKETTNAVVGFAVVPRVYLADSVVPSPGRGRTERQAAEIVVNLLHQRDPACYVHLENVVRQVPRAAMPVLYLHVGHSKTGTSWLQAALRESLAALAGGGLTYPILDGIGDEQGAEIGQGNGLALAAAPVGELNAGLRRIAGAAGPAGVVLSSEEFFPRLTLHDEPAVLPRAAMAAGFGRIEILLFIRNPVGHAASLWQQYLKRGGGSAPIDAFFERYRVPERVARFLDRFASMDAVGLTCLNYDRHRHDLLAPLRAWLGQPEITLTPPRTSTINRGMTRAELALQAALNRRVGRAGRILSDALCNGLPELPPDRIYPDPACQRAMCERLAPALAHVNAHLPEVERYRCDMRTAAESADGATLSFGPEQIELIGAALGSEIRRLRQALVARRREVGGLEPSGER